jgi:hypothetical protein
MDNSDRPVGYKWLIREYSLSTFPLSHESYIGARARSDATRQGVVQEIFPPTYWPGDDAFDHLVFALKYDDFNPDVLRQTLERLGSARIRQYVETQPNSKYARQLGYLYEFFTGDELPLAVPIGGAYVDLLDPDRYMVSAAVRSTRWHVNDNLLGSRRFCPVVRKNTALRALLDVDVRGQLSSFQERVDPALFQRAIDYLYFKETRSSFDIERDTPTPDKEQRFVRALRDAGSTPIAAMLSEPELAGLQNLIVEQRYAQKNFRTWQNYVGESMPGRDPRVHYVCPPGNMVHDLMAGLLDCARRTDGLHAVVRAALVSFGFVFIHPFEDGNGRIHRYLIHDFLGRDGVVPAGMVLPVSAYMLHHPQEYDQVLEAFSKPLRTVVSISLDEQETLTINNPAEVTGAYRYPDLTKQAQYLLHAVEQTVNTELVSEILFIRGYDRAKAAMGAILDMPNKRLDLLIKLLHQNGGRLSRGRRKDFKELSDDELLRLESAYRDGFAETSLDPDADPGN